MSKSPSRAADGQVQNEDEEVLLLNAADEESGGRCVQMVDYCLATGHREAVHCERLSQQTDQATPYPREFQSCTPSSWPDDFVQFELVMAGVFAVAYVLLQRRKRVVAMAHYQRIHGREMDPLEASHYNV